MSNPGENEKAKRQRFTSRDLDLDAMVVTLKFKGIDKQLSINVSELPDSVKSAAMVDGIGKYLQSAYTGAKTAAEAYRLASETAATLATGQYQIGREATGGNAFSDLCNAIDAMLSEQGKPALSDASKANLLAKYQLAKSPSNWIDEANKVLDTAQKEARKAIKDLEGHPKIAAHIARIQAERAARAASDSDDSEELDLDNL